MSYLVTVVHGTFAPNSPWTSAGSDFCKRLEESVDERMDFIPFKWSGKNSHSARIAASKNLAVFLQEQLKESPAKKKVIIAHSHGGNIAMYALRSLGGESMNFQLVTMATPFLNTEVREVQKNLNEYKYMIPISLCFTLTYLYCFMAFHFLQYLQLFSIVENEFFAAFSTIPIICLNIYVVGPKIYRYLKKHLPEIPYQVNALQDLISLKQELHQYPILAMIDRSDEIRMWFGNLSRIWELILKLHFIIVSFWRKIGKYAAYCTAFIMPTAFISGLFGMEEGTLDKFVEWPWWIVTFTLVGYVVIPWITFVIPAVFIIIRSNPFVLGWESWQQQMLIKTLPSIAPHGYKKLSFIEYNFKRASILSLQHSIYDNHIVTSDIANWIVSLSPTKSKIKS